MYFPNFPHVIEKPVFFFNTWMAVCKKEKSNGQNVCVKKENIYSQGKQRSILAIPCCILLLPTFANAFCWKIKALFIQGPKEIGENAIDGENAVVWIVDFQKSETH